MNRIFLLVAALLLVALPASAQDQEPDRTAARALGMRGSITVEQGAAIAAQHLGAETATFVEEERERSVMYYDYRVETPEGPMEVEVRQLDGAVMEVEPFEKEDGEDDDGAMDDEAGDDEAGDDD